MYAGRCISQSYHVTQKKKQGTYSRPKPVMFETGAGMPIHSCRTTWLIGDGDIVCRVNR